MAVAPPLATASTSRLRSACGAVPTRCCPYWTSTTKAAVSSMRSRAGGRPRAFARRTFVRPGLRPTRSTAEASRPSATRLTETTDSSSLTKVATNPPTGGRTPNPGRIAGKRCPTAKRRGSGAPSRIRSSKTPPDAQPETMSAQEAVSRRGTFIWLYVPWRQPLHRPFGVHVPL